MGTHRRHLEILSAPRRDSLRHARDLARNFQLQLLCQHRAPMIYAPSCVAAAAGWRIFAIATEVQISRAGILVLHNGLSHAERMLEEACLHERARARCCYYRSSTSSSAAGRRGVLRGFPVAACINEICWSSQLAACLILVVNVHGLSFR